MAGQPGYGKPMGTKVVVVGGHGHGHKKWVQIESGDLFLHEVTRCHKRWPVLAGSWML